jgi:hypothetical protein
MRGILILSLFSGVVFAATTTVIPVATQNGVTVGPGWAEATNRQVLRTASNHVYVVASDDSPCTAATSPASGVIRVYKGSGAQAGNANVPTSFAEVDSAHHPKSAGSGSCVFTGGTANLLFAPDSRLDSNGIIHIAYIDPSSSNNGTVYYQTFDTNTDLWSARTQIAAGAETNVGGGWPRGSHAALTLDSTDHPFVTFASGGSANSIQWTAKTASGGNAWTTPAQIPGSAGTDQFQTTMITALDHSIHLAWLDNALAAHSSIRYAKFAGGAWGATETVSAGDANVLGDGNHDQIPAVVADLTSRPCVLYLDGTVNGTDNYVRMRCKNASGTWVDDSPSGVAGVSNPNGTWYCHTPTNYISSSGDIFVFLGHDVNISPGPFQFQVGGLGNNWSPVNQLDPRNQSNTTPGAPGLDGSASVRFDPLRDNNPGLIDVLYYDEDDGTAGFSHHATLYYKAIQLSGASASPDVSLSFGSGATVTAGGSATGTLTVSSIAGFNSQVTFTVSGCPSLATCTIAPNAVTPGTGNPATATLTVTTTAPTVAGQLRDRRHFTVAGLVVSFGVLGFLFLRRQNGYGFVLMIAFALLMNTAGCSGGSGSGSNPGPTPHPGTPAGTYTIVVTGQSGSIVRSDGFVLTVR